MRSRFRMAAGLLTLLSLSQVTFAQGPAKPRPGELPTDAQGKPLNFDFETGSLKDWSAEGNAFEKQPVRGDTVARRRGDMKSNHAGEYWVGSYEIDGDAPQGTLTSVPFVVRQPWASFLIAGGSEPTTCVEIVQKDGGKLVARASGMNTEDLRPVAVDLTKYVGKEIFVRLVDKHSGGWGHINFDDFRFHAEKPNYPQPEAPLQADVFAHSGLSPEGAAKAMTVPEGFTVSLFAGEPDVQQPIAMALDDRGRLWVAEAYSYPIRVPEDQARDRILIFEDVDGDGKFDSRKVFADKLNLVSGLAVGFGGVWVGAAPNFLFIPDKNGDDRPDGPPEVLLDGWGYHDTHETLNAFIWGPDGWLYGCHGVFTHSRVGKPGTPDDERVPLNAGIWRYHPTRHTFEVFASGTSNPWGVDFNDRGEAFLTACVIPHLFHIIEGARYQRQAGPHFNPYTYNDIKTIAVHRHYLGATPHSGNGKSDSAGGGHAHAGAMIYLGGAWPAEYRDQIFMNNIHGARLNMDLLSPKGSGYEGNRAPDFLLANDIWSQILYFTYGPDGNVFMIDWYDRNQCHHGNIPGHDRSNGRIFKVSYQGTKPVTVDLKSLSDRELVDLQLHQNDWYVRHARRILQERGGNPEVYAGLQKIAFEHADDTRRLRGLWALSVTGGLNDTLLTRALQDNSPYVRAWAIRLATEQGAPSVPLISRLTQLAATDPAPQVRLALASAAQRLNIEQRLPMVTALTTHAEDADDHNLPLMNWYALEPIASQRPDLAVGLLKTIQIPVVKGYLVRRLTQLGEDQWLNAVLQEAFAAGQPVDEQIRLLQEVQEGLKGRRQVPLPPAWGGLYASLRKSDNSEVQSLAASLALTFGDPHAVEERRMILVDSAVPASVRIAALEALVRINAPGLAPTLQGLLKDPALLVPALRALAAYDDPTSATAILGAYGALPGAAKRDALNTLASRPAYALTLMDALEKKQIASIELTADVVRQLRNLKHPGLDKKLNDLWGTVRDTPEDKAKEIARLTKLLMAKPKADHAPDLAQGRAVYAKICQQCHTLFATGGKVGPDLTGSNRANLEYVLSNLVDPSALIGKDYQAHVLTTDAGRVLTGLIRAEDTRSVTLATANETVIIPKDEIDERIVSSKSMMPDDILRPLTEKDLRSLVAYLASPVQTPLLATADTLPLFFNGKDLTGWVGNPELWSVENGEIVGRSQGLKINEFLKSDLLLSDFRLTLQVKLVKNEGNSGIQFRSQILANGDVKGYQADAGAGWWGKLYEEHGRALLWDKSGEAHVRSGEWNEYVIQATGNRIQTWINGQPCVDLDDAPGAKRGITAFQLHSGGPTEVRFKDLRLELK